MCWRLSGLLLILIVLMVIPLEVNLAARSLTTPDQDSHTDLSPDNTVILANAADSAFCRDFSPLLKRTPVP